MGVFTCMCLNVCVYMCVCVCLSVPEYVWVFMCVFVCVCVSLRVFPPGFVRARGGGDIRDVNLNSENWGVVKAALVAGMYPNLLHVDRESNALMGTKEKRVRFHQKAPAHYAVCPGWR